MHIAWYTYTYAPELPFLLYQHPCHCSIFKCNHSRTEVTLLLYKRPWFANITTTAAPLSLFYLQAYQNPRFNINLNWGSPPFVHTALDAPEFPLCSSVSVSVFIFCKRKEHKASYSIDTYWSFPEDPETTHEDYCSCPRSRLQLKTPFPPPQGFNRAPVLPFEVDKICL